jgi:hypothetical protein
MLLNCLILALQVSGAPHTHVEDTVAQGHITAADTTSPVLTPYLFARLKTFIDHFHQEPETVLDSGKVHTFQVSPRLGRINGLSSSEQQQAEIVAGSAIQGRAFPDLIVLSSMFPSVAADLHNAGLQPQQLHNIAKAILNAEITDVGDLVVHNGTPGPVDTSTVVGRNVIFVRANQKDVEELHWLPPIAQLVAGGQALRQQLLQSGIKLPSDLNP